MWIVRLRYDADNDGEKIIQSKLWCRDLEAARRLADRVSGTVCFRVRVDVAASVNSKPQTFDFPVGQHGIQCIDDAIRQLTIARETLEKTPAPLWKRKLKVDVKPADAAEAK